MANIDNQLGLVDLSSDAIPPPVKTSIIKSGTMLCLVDLSWDVPNGSSIS